MKTVNNEYFLIEVVNAGESYKVIDRVIFKGLTAAKKWFSSDTIKALKEGKEYVIVKSEVWF